MRICKLNRYKVDGKMTEKERSHLSQNILHKRA
jgi:hypothetical protein